MFVPFIYAKAALRRRCPSFKIGNALYQSLRSGSSVGGAGNRRRSSGERGETLPPRRGAKALVSVIAERWPTCPRISWPAAPIVIQMFGQWCSPLPIRPRPAAPLSEFQGGGRSASGAFPNQLGQVAGGIALRARDGLERLFHRKRATAGHGDGSVMGRNRCGRRSRVLRVR